MWSTRIATWLYGLLWIHLDMLTNHCINCILVGSKHTVSQYFNQTQEPYAEIKKSVERNSEQNETSPFSKYDYTKGKKVKKKFSISLDNRTDDIFLNNIVLLDSSDGHETIYTDNESPYFISYPRNPFGASILWTGQQMSQTELPQSKISLTDVQNKHYSDNKKVETREKRGVTHLYNMVGCTTGCNPLSYKGYGCYCGFLGSGVITDPIDRCCMIHDLCYTNIRCPAFSVYITPYLWRCWNGYPECAPDNGYTSCASELCECDRQLALCLANWPCPSKRAFCTSSPFRLLQNLLLF